MRKPAFSLIELLVVVAILVFTSGFGFVTFFRSQDRWLVENKAKEIITYLRQVQGYARNGDRGVGDCKQSPADIAEGKSKLTGWITILANSGLNSYATCDRYLNGIDRPATRFHSRPVPFTPQLPEGFVLYCGNAGADGSARLCDDADPSSTAPDPDVIKFDSLFSNVTIGNVDGNKSSRYILEDRNNKQYAYQFNISNGAITNGCFCMDGAGNLGGITSCDPLGNCH